MTETDIFRTRNIDCAVFLAYATGNHLSTVREGERLVFTFGDTVQCRDLVDLFFGPEPVQISDLKVLNDANKAVRRTMRHADSNGGTWERAL